MENKIFLVGIIAGIIGAMGIAAVFSVLTSQTNEQMMGNYQGQMGPGMIYGQQRIVQSNPYTWHSNDRNSFSSVGISSAKNVQITGISITGEHEVTVNLRYNGNSSTPSITVIATDPWTMMSSMHGMMGFGYPEMMNGYGPGYGVAPMISGYGYNSTEWQAFHSQMIGGGFNGYGSMMRPYYYNQTQPNSVSPMTELQPGSGSTILSSGWQTGGSSVKIRLDGQGSAYDSSAISVMIFPLTS